MWPESHPLFTTAIETQAPKRSTSSLRPVPTWLGQGPRKDPEVCRKAEQERRTWQAGFSGFSLSFFLKRRQLCSEPEEIGGGEGSLHQYRLEALIFSSKTVHYHFWRRTGVGHL